jgi:hypothetical protein
VSNVKGESLRKLRAAKAVRLDETACRGRDQAHSGVHRTPLFPAPCPRCALDQQPAIAQLDETERDDGAGVELVDTEADCVRIGRKDRRRNHGERRLNGSGLPPMAAENWASVLASMRDSHLLFAGRFGFCITDHHCSTI